MRKLSCPVCLGQRDSSYLVQSLPLHIEQREVLPSCSASKLTGLTSSEKSKQRLRSGAVFEGGKQREGELLGGRCLTYAAFICITGLVKPANGTQCVSGRGGQGCSIVGDLHQTAVQEPADMPQLQKGDF